MWKGEWKTKMYLTWTDNIWPSDVHLNNSLVSFLYKTNENSLLVISDRTLIQFFTRVSLMELLRSRQLYQILTPVLPDATPFRMAASRPRTRSRELRVTKGRPFRRESFPPPSLAAGSRGCHTWLRAVRRVRARSNRNRQSSSLPSCRAANFRAWYHDEWPGREIMLTLKVGISLMELSSGSISALCFVRKLIRWDYMTLKCHLS